jgi:hypothetical protein
VVVEAQPSGQEPPNAEKSPLRHRMILGRRWCRERASRRLPGHPRSPRRIAVPACPQAVMGRVELRRTASSSATVLRPWRLPTNTIWLSAPGHLRHADRGALGRREVRPHRPERPLAVPLPLPGELHRPLALHQAAGLQHLRRGSRGAKRRIFLATMPHQDAKSHATDSESSECRLIDGAANCGDRAFDSVKIFRCLSSGRFGNRDGRLCPARHKRACWYCPRRV